VNVIIGSFGLFKIVSFIIPKYEPAKIAPIPPVVIASAIGPVLNDGIIKKTIDMTDSKRQPKKIKYILFINIWKK
jgi:hypothetical protein